MEVVAGQVKAVYVAAARLKMERVVNYCAQFLVDHLDPATAIEIRALPGIQRNPELSARVDAFLAAEALKLFFLILFFSIYWLDKMFQRLCRKIRSELWLIPRQFVVFHSFKWKY